MAAKEFFNSVVEKRKRDTKYFETISCSECDGYNNLQRHKYSDEIMCDDCIEKINEEMRRAEEEDCEKEHYYTDYTYAELIQERNS